MRRAWPGTPEALLSDPDAASPPRTRRTPRTVELGVSEGVVVTSSWHRVRAGVLFRSLLPGVRVSVVSAPAGVTAPLSP